MNIVISQPMFFPWVGLFEQIRLADVYVHYGDVQFSKGSFVNRVQIKTPEGVRWLTVPLQNVALGQLIDDVQINESTDWRTRHLNILERAYSEAPYRTQMLDLVRSVYEQKAEGIGQLSRRSIEACCAFYGLNIGKRFVESKQTGIGGKGSERVLEIVKVLGGAKYITGWGAKNYLDHSQFERAGIEVEYMNYEKRSYPQLHGEFTPYVSILDLIANTGRDGLECIQSGTVGWKEWIKHG